MIKEELPPDWLRIYQLQESENPYQLKKPLNPLDNEEDARLLTPVEGFSEIEEIDKILDEAQKKEPPTPTFFLVTGRSGSGRSSMANYILYKYRKVKGITEENFIVPKLKIRNSSDYDLLNDWLVKLQLLLYQKNIDTKDVDNLIDTLTPDNFRRKLKLGLLKIYQALDGKKSGFGVCFEEIPSKEQIGAVLDAFEATGTVCVFILPIEREIYQDSKNLFQQAKSDGKISAIIELSYLLPHEAKEVLEQRWNSLVSVSDSKPSPFQEIKNAFDDHPTFGRLITSVNQILFHNATVVSESKPELLWTGKEKELSFEDEKIKKILNQLEEYKELFENTGD